MKQLLFFNLKKFNRLTLKIVLLGLATSSCVRVSSPEVSLQSLSVSTTKNGTNYISEFSGLVLDYAVTLPAGKTKVFVETKSISTGTTITYSPEVGADGRITVPANKKVTITCTSLDGKTVKVYTLTFTITPSNTDATLKSLSVNIAKDDGKNLLEDFVATTTTYSLALPSGTTVVFVVAQTNDIGAIVDYQPVKEAGGITLTADKTVIMSVTSPDGTTRRTYTIIFT